MEIEDIERRFRISSGISVGSDNIGGNRKGHDDRPVITNRFIEHTTGAINRIIGEAEIQDVPLAMSRDINNLREILVQHKIVEISSITGAGPSVTEIRNVEVTKNENSAIAIWNTKGRTKFVKSVEASFNSSFHGLNSNMIKRTNRRKIYTNSKNHTTSRFKDNCSDELIIAGAAVKVIEF